MPAGLAGMVRCSSGVTERSGARSAGWLQACAAALTARLVSDGFVNSLVYLQPTPAPGVLQVVEGRLTQPLVGQVLHVPGVALNLQRLRNLRAIGSERGSLSRLGSDVAQAVFTLRVQPGSQPWHGDLSLRNDGTNGSGEGRAVGTLVKGDLLSRSDTLLLYGELDGSDAPALGAAIGSISYTLPLNDQLNLTGAFGSSRRNLIELPDPAHGLSTNQIQGLGQLEWVFQDSLIQRRSVFAGLSANSSNTSLDGASLASIVPANVRGPRSGYLRLGVSGSGLAATPADQRDELASVGIVPGQATAIGALLSGVWNLAPGGQLQLRGGGQVAFHPLSSAMQFTLGSDVGIRGLPGQVISGDSGWLGSGEVAWSFWQTRNMALQLWSPSSAPARGAHRGGGPQLQQHRGGRWGAGALVAGPTQEHGARLGAPPPDRRQPRPLERLAAGPGALRQSSVPVLNSAELHLQPQPFGGQGQFGRVEGWGRRFGSRCAQQHRSAAALHLDLERQQPGPADQKGQGPHLGFGVAVGGGQQGLAGGLRPGRIGLGSDRRQAHSGEGAHPPHQALQPCRRQPTAHGQIGLHLGRPARLGGPLPGGG